MTPTVCIYARISSITPMLLHTQRYLEALHGKVARLKPKFAANVVWACATLRVPCEAFCTELAGCMSDRVQEYPPKQLANLLWGWARLNYTPTPELVDAVVEQVQRRARQVAPQDWDSLLWGLIRLQEPVPTVLLDQCADTLVQLKRHVKGRTLCSIIKSFSACLDKPTYSVELLVSVRADNHSRLLHGGWVVLQRRCLYCMRCVHNANVYTILLALLGCLTGYPSKHSLHTSTHTSATN